jgi:hypothetical protein
MARFNLDPDALPELSPTQRRQLNRMTDAEITAAAKADADNPPLTRDELGKLRGKRGAPAAIARRPCV